MHKTILLFLLTLLPTAAFSTTNYDPGVNGNIGGFQGTNATSYTPTFTGLGTVASISFFYWRAGDRLFVHGTYTSGTVSGSLASITLPTGLNIDTAKITNAANNAASPRVGFNESPGANALHPVLASVTSATNLVYIGNQTNGATQTTPQTGSTCCSSSVIFTVDFNVPISGWSAGGASSPALITGATADRIERAKIAAPSGGNCAITSQSGTWISGTPTSSGTGLCTITIAAGYFSAAPTCTCTTDGGVGRACAFNGVPTSTSMTTYTGNTSSPENNTIHVICIGPR